MIMIMAMLRIAPRRPMTDDAAALLKLFTWLSPAFPVGSFAFSHGLEWAAETGDIRDAPTLEAWLSDLLAYGAPRSDAVLLAAVWRSPERFADLNELALALAPSAERHLETAAQGSAFLSAVSAAWPTSDLVRLAERHAAHEVAYPVIVGAAAASHGIALGKTLQTFLLAGVSNLVSAIVRLGPIGQSDAQAIIARLTAKVAAIADWAHGATLDDLGTATWRADIASMRHENQYSRLFRS